MSRTTHTPGPWGAVATSNHAHDYRLTKPDGSPLPVSAEANDHTEQRANARLIAAAPDLLAALEAAEGHIEWANEVIRLGGVSLETAGRMHAMLKEKDHASD